MTTNEASIQIIDQINRDERDARDAGHDLECYETNMELLWEAGTIKGPHDPRLLSEILAADANGTLDCRCDE
jgi:hypothetical protein